MLNFRKLKQDFSPSVISDGERLFAEGMVIDAKILHLDGECLRISASVRGNFDNVYEAEIEINRQASELIDSNCDCTYRFDCQHLAALLYFLEKNLDALLVAFSKDKGLTPDGGLDRETQNDIQETLQLAQQKETARQDQQYQTEALAEYCHGAEILARSLFFVPDRQLATDRAELALLVHPAAGTELFGLQMALRLPQRSKPLSVPDLEAFLEAAKFKEPMEIGGRRYFFTMESFDEVGRQLLQGLMEIERKSAVASKALRAIQVDMRDLGTLLARSYELAVTEAQMAGYVPRLGETLPLPGLFWETLEKPIEFSPPNASLRFVVEVLRSPAPKLFLKPTIVLDSCVVSCTEVQLLTCAAPGLLHEKVYYRFAPQLTRLHLRDLDQLEALTVPEPLIGSFIENALPQLARFAEVANQEALEQFATLPFAESLKARCAIEYLDGELEARLFFRYGEMEVPAAFNQLSYEQITAFVTPHGILARDLVQERALIEDLFAGFLYEPETGVFAAKTEKKIVEFMTELLPRYQEIVQFECPPNLLEQFLYDDTQFELAFGCSDRIDVYEVELTVKGHLKGTSLDQLWDAISANRNYIELYRPQADAIPGRKGVKNAKPRKILVLDLQRLTPAVQLFDEIGLTAVDDHRQERPLWSLASLQPEQFKDLPITVSIAPKLQDIQRQMLGETSYPLSPVPKDIQVSLHKYQVEGVGWLERLRRMHLSGILADDMGLGKTVQAITALTQYSLDGGKNPSLVVCPTSLLYNWKEELSRFSPKLKVLVVDGTPAQRKKLISKTTSHHVIITSYSLLQKDIEAYATYHFGYAILDEAQHIKNRGTRNAKSAKLVRAEHRLILTGTPIENSLEELWSLFDFLMPGLLSSYERFVERYLRPTAATGKPALETLSRKVAPFILRRMKEDVLDDLPPVTETVYYCTLSSVQRQLYQSYAASAREELSRLVQKEGFERVQIHVLATLTRLKQICCHPAIFAKERAEEGDSAKYDMMLELLGSLIEGKHKTVIFSQYTQMLKIMREDLERLGIRFAYLDGSTKNRLEVVKSFNEDPRILVFLVSLKAGGTGLNLVGADAVVHFDLWWNPAIQEQATDRVHRIGQERPVSSLKLVSLGTIEEKVLELQRRKKGLVKQVVTSDDEVVSKLTWEEVLELLQC
jgi:superfamily II DNA or RNA helicase